jgi:gas vesicle protein
MGEEASTSEKALYLMLAPRTGEETRKLIASKARESADIISNRTKNVAEKSSEFVDRGKEVLQHQRDQISAAIEAGKQAYKEEKEKA